MAGKVLSGRYKGRSLPVAKGIYCRPTLTINLERIFDWLQGKIFRAKCLDLFAGSGALGLEALSRGAESVTMCEKNILQAQAIQMEWSDVIKTHSLHLLSVDAIDYLMKYDPASYDIVFLDPPFRGSYWSVAEELLIQRGWMSKGGLLVREIPNNYKDSILEKPFALIRERRCSNLTVQIYRVI